MPPPELPFSLDRSPHTRRWAGFSLLWSCRWLFLPVIVVFSIAPAMLAQEPSSSAQVFLRNGQAALERGDFHGAVQSFEQARQLAPDNIQAARGLLLSYLQDSRIAQALDLVHNLVERWPQDVQLHHLLGLAFFKNGQNTEAAAQLREAQHFDA